MVLCNLAFITKRLYVILMSLKVVHFQIACVDVTVNLYLQVRVVKQFVFIFSLDF